MLDGKPAPALLRAAVWTTASIRRGCDGKEADPAAPLGSRLRCGGRGDRTIFREAPARGTPEADRFDLLALIIEDYERKHWPIEAPDPVDAIRYRMETAATLRQISA